MTNDEAVKQLEQADKHMAAAGMLARQVLAETPREEAYYHVRRRARYIESGVCVPELAVSHVED